MTPNATTTDNAPTVEDVWRRFGAEIRSFVGRRVSDPHRADDLVADILLKVHRSLGSLDDPERLAAWLFRIARNAITDEYRRAATAREIVGSAPGERVITLVDVPADSDDVQRELATCVRPMLSGLAPDYRRALELTYLDGVTQVAAAELEGITVSGMKSRVQRARKQLAELYDRCCALTLDARGMPIDYTPAEGCGGGSSCGCQ